MQHGRVLIDTGKDPRELDRQEELRQNEETAEKQAAEARRKHTLRSLCATYCDHLKAQEKISCRDAEGILKNHLLNAFPTLADTPAAEVTKTSVVAAQRKLIEAGKKTTARKLRAFLRATYTSAIRADSDSTLPAAFVEFGITDNPVASTAPIKSRPTKNPLPQKGSSEVWNALKLEQNIVGAALRLHLLTGGQRAAQLVRVNADRDLTKDTIRILDPKGKRAQEARKGCYMNREDLEHLIRAAAEVTDEYEFVIVGSQSILGPIPNPPAELKMSMEADIYPMNTYSAPGCRQPWITCLPRAIAAAGGSPGSPPWPTPRQAAH